MPIRSYVDGSHLNGNFARHVQDPSIIAGIVLAVPVNPVFFLALVERTTASWLHIAGD